MRLNHNQTLILQTLREHAAGGGEAIGTRELDHELDRRHNRHMNYDAMHAVLKRLAKRGLVDPDGHRPTRWKITETGKSALS